MPLVTDANGVASWIDDADLEAAFRAAAGDTADTVATGGTPPAAAHGISPPAVVTNTDVLGVPNPTPASPPLTVEQWCAKGFEADVWPMLLWTAKPCLKIWLPTLLAPSEP